MIRIQGLSEGGDVFGGTLDENQRWDRRGKPHMVIKFSPKRASSSVRNDGAGTALFALRVTRSNQRQEQLIKIERLDAQMLEMYRI